jgi:HD-GYP domain-containing protein (c-di-GMP phosphodiesterase class II)
VNLGYVTVFLGSLGYGLRGGLAAGALLTLLIGPVGASIGLPLDPPASWLLRGAVFLGIGTLNGLLVDRARRLASAWRETAQRVEQRERSGILALARGAEAKDEQTGDHIRRVQATAHDLARATGATVDLSEQIGWAAMLHDVGKLHVPDSILRKPGPLTPDEWAVVRNHTVWGERILGDGEGFELARRVARWHHENVDGSGYPDGLLGSRIPFEARIVRIADAFDAMTNRRPYSEPRTVDEALEELFRWQGKQFDPELVRLMPALVNRAAAPLSPSLSPAQAHVAVRAGGHPRRAATHRPVRVVAGRLAP